MTRGSESVFMGGVPLPTLVSLCRVHHYKRGKLKGHQQLIEASVALDLTFLQRTRSNVGRNVKSATLAMPETWRRAAFRVICCPGRPRTGHLPQSRTGRQDCVQKLAIIIDDQGMAAAPETAAVGTACVRMARWARGHLRPAVTRKGYA